jgi:hypothetical protein
MWMNEGDIDEALETVRHHAPEYLPYIKYLSDWRDTINSNSDGWPYWTAGTRCASKLMELVAQLMSSIRGYGGREVSRPEIKELAKSLTSIKSCATRHKLPVPVLGGDGATESEDTIKDDMQYVAWIEETLIPDLKDSGTVETAKDFERLVRIIKRLAGR